jgi:SSS family solute:Na+ symporter
MPGPRSLAETLSETAPIAVGAFVAYLLLVVGIGVYASRYSSAGVAHFYLAGRKLNRFVVALSAVVSGRSAWLMVGFTGIAYQRGASAVWATVGYTVVELFLFLGYARRLRRFAEVYDCITLPDFFAARFPDRGPALRVLLVAVIVIFMVGYVSAQFVAGGKAFASSFGLSTLAGVLLTAGIVLAYTSLGGFLAVSLTDVLQAVFMIIGLVVLPVVAIADGGGWGRVMEELRTLEPTLVDPAAIGWGALIGFLGIGLGSPGNPHIIVRYMSIRDPEQLRTSALIGTLWNVVLAAGALLIGLVGRVYFPSPASLPGGDTEHLYPVLAQAHLPAVLFGVVLASIFAAIMSTADSQLLVATSGVVHDLYERLLHRGESLSPRRLILMSRVMVVLLVAVAVAMGLLTGQLVFWLVLFAWAGLGAALGPTSILALYWRRTTGAGVVAGLLTGTATVFIWYNVPFLKAIVHEIVPSFLLALAATVAVSLMSRRPDGVAQAFAAMVSLPRKGEDSSPGARQG